MTCHTRDFGDGWLPRPQSLQTSGANGQAVDIGLHLRRPRIGLNTSCGNQQKSACRHNESKWRFVTNDQGEQCQSSHSFLRKSRVTIAGGREAHSRCPDSRATNRSHHGFQQRAYMERTADEPQNAPVYNRPKLKPAAVPRLSFPTRPTRRSFHVIQPHPVMPTGFTTRHSPPCFSRNRSPPLPQSAPEHTCSRYTIARVRALSNPTFENSICPERSPVRRARRAIWSRVRRI